MVGPEGQVLAGGIAAEMRAGGHLVCLAGGTQGAGRAPAALLAAGRRWSVEWLPAGEIQVTATHWQEGGARRGLHPGPRACLMPAPGRAPAYPLPPTPPLLQVTGFGYEHDEAWATNMHLFKHFTDVSQGVRRLGSAAIDMCHVATGARFSAFPPCRRRPDALPAGPGNRPRSQLCVAIQPGAQLAKVYNAQPSNRRVL